MKTLIQKDTYTPMFIAALIIRVKIWIQPKVLLTDKWIKKMEYVYMGFPGSSDDEEFTCNAGNHGSVLG